MKTEMKRIINFIGMFAVAALLVQGCSDITDTNFQDDAIESSTISAANVDVSSGNAGIYWGKNRVEVGSVDYTLNGDFIDFDISTDVGIEDIHIWVGNNLDYPQNKKGTPIPGRFPYNSDKDGDFSKGVTNYTVNYSTDGINTEAPIYMIVHFALENGETAFSGCFENEGKGRWWNWIQWGSIDENDVFDPAPLCGETGGGGIGGDGDSKR